MINVEAILHRYTPSGDRSYKFTFQTTKEGTEQLFTELGRKYLKVCRVVCVSDDDVGDPEQIVQSEPPPAPKVEDGKKMTRSQELRFWIKKEWEFLGQPDDSDAHYDLRMKGFIREVKEGLEPPLPEER